MAHWLVGSPAPIRLYSAVFKHLGLLDLEGREVEEMSKTNIIDIMNMDSTLEGQHLKAVLDSLLNSHVMTC